MSEQTETTKQENEQQEGNEGNLSGEVVQKEVVKKRVREDEGDDESPTKKQVQFSSVSFSRSAYDGAIGI